jgi:hypothetical protein
MRSHEINMLKATMHPVNICMSWRLSGGFILVMANTYSGHLSMFSKTWWDSVKAI